MNFTQAMNRDAARATDHLARAQRRPIVPITAPRMADLLSEQPTPPTREISDDEHACMDAILRAAETDNENT